MRIGFHASHEQLPPSALLAHVRLAERAGFQAAMCSDHFAPWTARQHDSGSAWSWLGAALEATGLTYGTVCAPGQRYHPAIIAQAAATLAEMYEGRLWVALGSGEFLNEHITRDPWPPKDERNQRLLECVDVMRRLFAGEEVTHDGLVRVDRARLHSRPATPPPLYAAALSAETAAWAGGWADGLILAPTKADEAARAIDAFRAGGGRDKPVLLQIVVSYAATDEQALAAAHDQWRFAVLDAARIEDLATPADFDAATADVPAAAVGEKLFASADPAEHLRYLRSFSELGARTAYVHNVALDQPAFIDTYARHVLPAFARASAAQP